MIIEQLEIKSSELSFYYFMAHWIFAHHSDFVLCNLNPKRKMSLSLNVKQKNVEAISSSNTSFL